MTTRTRKLAVAIAWLTLLMASPPIARAEPDPTVPAVTTAPVWRVEAEQSGCDFTLRALGWFKISGRFARIEGAVRPSADGYLASIRVPLSSVAMSSRGRRDWALSSEFFDAARHPELLFDAHLPGVDRESLRRPIRGVLQLRGVRAAATFRVVQVDCDPETTRCLVTAESKVSRRRFGMTSQRLLLGDTVKLRLHLVLSRVAPGVGLAGDQ